MRDLVFNQASTRCEGVVEEYVGNLLVQMSQGMAYLVARKLCAAEMRAVEALPVVRVGALSLWEVLVAMLRARKSVEEVTFLMAIAHRTPLLTGATERICDNYYSSSYDGDQADREGLVYCAISGGIGISLATSDEWLPDLIGVDLVVLSEGGELERRREEINHVSSVECATTVELRLRVADATDVSTRGFWLQKQDIFPNLQFGLDVEASVRSLDEGTFALVRTRLFELDAAAEEWSRTGSPAPRYRSLVTGESDSTMANPLLVRARTFRNRNGVSLVYEWHARFGGGGRIHFVANPILRQIEIGYIGPHLPL